MLRIITCNTCYKCDLRPVFLNDAPGEEEKKWKYSADLDKNALIIKWWHLMTLGNDNRRFIKKNISYKIYSSRLWFVFIFFLGKYAEIRGLFTYFLTAILNSLQSIRIQCWMKSWDLFLYIGHLTLLILRIWRFYTAEILRTSYDCRFIVYAQHEL